ncbi:MAG: PAS domain-containing protein [Candidatus Cloacimonetes bacterium]|jgi:transcriptional regulator with PAS, ATPase and Fis domain|nr:PAS domain-containing protein [Candidatus Cloacimonadota bacterium]MDY0172854.1 PAS domain-containing protein [Candidatus Cloacimonadaceae bacterium]
MQDWVKELPVAITVCDKDAIVLEMNDKAAETFSKQGGKALIGTSLFDCHKPHSCEVIKAMLASGEPNTYTISKNGQKKMIHQQPWYIEGEVAGLVEFSIVLPDDMKHYDRG